MPSWKHNEPAYEFQDHRQCQCHQSRDAEEDAPGGAKKL